MSPSTAPRAALVFEQTRGSTFLRAHATCATLDLPRLACLEWLDYLIAHAPPLKPFRAKLEAAAAKYWDEPAPAAAPAEGLKK